MRKMRLDLVNLFMVSMYLLIYKSLTLAPYDISRDKVSWVLFGIVAISILVNGLALIRDVLLSIRDLVRTLYNKCQRS